MITFHCVYHPQSSGLVEPTNGVIKIQLVKLVESFNLPWLKALLLVLLNLNLLPLANSLFPFEIITGRPMRLRNQGMYEPALLKGDLIYCKEMVAQYLEMLQRINLTQTTSTKEL